MTAVDGPGPATETYYTAKGAVPGGTIHRTISTDEGAVVNIDLDQDGFVLGVEVLS